MTMEGLQQENEALKREIFLLKEELEKLKKMLFGAKRERFVSALNPAQGELFEREAEAVVEVEEVEVEQSQARQKPKKKIRRLVKRNTFPANLRREPSVLAPDPDPANTEEWVKIGEDITELLAYKPAEIYVRQIVRPRYAHKTQEEQGVIQAPIPARLIPKGIVDESLIAELVVEKILFHTPIYRFGKKLKQAGIHFISQSNLNNWFHSAAHALRPLGHLLHKDLLAQLYNQVDETRIPVLSKNKPGASHLGYFWVMNNPELRAVYFHYDARRSAEASQGILEGFKGIVQSDGYSVYELAKRQTAIQLIYCMAHARRKFVEAQNTDPPRANYFLERVQKLYAIEQRAREDKRAPAERLALRQKEALPILEELGQWLMEQFSSGKLTPRSLIYKAIEYSLKRWKGLCAYAHDGQLEIDNNLVENTIRPVALGRKNFLFAGSDEAAENLACLYSIIGTAKMHDLNVRKYLEWLLRQVASQKVNNQALYWLPHRLSAERKEMFSN
jgi:transposase